MQFREVIIRNEQHKDIVAILYWPGGCTMKGARTTNEALEWLRSERETIWKEWSVVLDVQSERKVMDRA